MLVAKLSKELQDVTITASAQHLKVLRENIPSGFSVWDECLGGGWPRGGVVELGLPFGMDAREFLVTSLASMQRQSLWIYPSRYLGESVSIYPPAWAARGISLAKNRFVKTDMPIVHLKSIFMSSVFDVIVCDGVSSFEEGDWAFVAQQARRHRYVLIALNHRRLHSRKGNIWAGVRANLTSIPSQGRVYRVEAVRGLSPGVHDII